MAAIIHISLHNMGRSKKFDYQAAILASLNAHPDGLTLDELLERSGFEVDRSTLFRHLARLIQSGGAERIGNARASRYRSRRVAGIAAEPALPDTPRPEVRQPPVPREHSLPIHHVRSAEVHPPPGAETVAVPVLPPEHRAVVRKAVRTVVREWKRYDRVNLKIYLSLLAKAEHLDALAAAVEAELDRLHEGNLAEFDLSQAEFAGFIPPVTAAGREATGE